jgi:hypothetical protein
MEAAETSPAAEARFRLRKGSLFFAAGLLAALAFPGCITYKNRQLETSHRHCIKVAGSAFRLYAMDHGGLFPFHTNGFGDALLLLVKEQRLPGVDWICGPGDDGIVLSNALISGSDVPEEQCSRIYLQGLSETNDLMLCILFDRKSVPGGDHFYGEGRPVRETCLLDGSMQTVSDEEWPEFSRQQVELLVAAGWTRERALSFYPGAKQR